MTTPIDEVNVRKTALTWKEAKGGHKGSTATTFSADVTEYDAESDLIVIAFETPAKCGKDVTEKVLALLDSLC